MRHVVRGVANSMLIKPWVPDRSPVAEFLARAIGEPAPDELHRLLQRHVRRRRDQQMDMIWHKDEFMHLYSSLLPVKADYVQQKITESIRLQKESALESRERDKKASNLLRCKSQG